MQWMKLVLASAFSATLVFSAQAADTAHSPSASSGAVWVTAEVVKIEKDSRIVLKHGDLKNLGMSATTSSFIPKDKSMGDVLRPGTTIQIRAEKVGDKLKVVDWSPAN